MANFQRLIRFQDSSGQTYYGDIGDDWKGDLSHRNIAILDGDLWNEGFRPSGKQAMVAKVLCPLPAVPMIIGVGLNYKHHAEEAGLPIPLYPVIFTKYRDALAGPYEDIPINVEASDLDYEGELTVIIGKDCKNLSESENPLNYVLGYTTGNDVSSRHWQDPKISGAQHGYAKSFDKFAPIGPVIASTVAIKDPIQLKIVTRVNGDIRQDGSTNDLIFSIEDIIRHLSRGMTLRRGTVIMTGTPSGVGAFHKPPAWLKDGDIVEIEIEGIGKIKNKMVFER